MEQEQYNPCGCTGREPPRKEMKRRFTGCGVIDITPRSVKTWLKLADRLTNQLLTVTCEQIEMQLVRKGRDHPFVVYPAFSKTDHEVSFYWDDAFLTAAPGLYLGDVFISGEYCFTVKFRIKKCDVAVVNCRTEMEVECSPCEEGCDDGKDCTPMDVIESMLNPNELCKEPCHDC